MSVARLLSLLLVLSLGACASGGFLDRLFNGRPVPAAPPHYVVGPAYRAGGVWRYPREQFEYDETGLAEIAGPHERLTADGEAFDAGAMAAAHRTLQLPAIGRVTNLRTGRSVLVRINDRGPENPGRLVALSRRAAELLGIGAEPAPIRLQIDEVQSRQLAAQVNGEPPKLAVATAALGDVRAEALAPPQGAAQSARVRTASPPPPPVATAAPTMAAPVPLRLPEQVTQGPARSGLLYIDAGNFSQRSAADLLRRRIAELGAETTTSYAAPRDRAYQVRIGPLGSVAAADAMLARALRGGVPDARIVVD